MHPLMASSAAAGLASDIAASVQGIGDRLDVELAGVETADLDAVRSLARRIGSACGAAGNRGPALRWRNDALAVLGARERLLCGDECPCINLGVDGARLILG